MCICETGREILRCQVGLKEARQPAPAMRMDRVIVCIAPLFCLLGCMSSNLKHADLADYEQLERVPGRETRTLEFRREMMRKNAYLGEWRESHHVVDFTLSFVTNGLGVLRYRDTVLPFRWKSNGAGKITLAIDNGERITETPPLTYDPVKDSIDAAFNGVKFEDAFTGDLKFKSVELSSWVVPTLERYTRPKPVPPPDVTINRAARYEKMVADNDPELKTLNSWSEVLSPGEIISKSVRWETVDLEYPRITMSRSPMVRESVKVIIAYGIRGRVPSAKDDTLWEGRKSRQRLFADKDLSLKVSWDGLNGLIEEIKKRDLSYGCYIIDYGKNGQAWQEGVLAFHIGKEDREEMMPLLAGCILNDSRLPRHYSITKVPTYEEEDRILMESIER